MISLRCTTYLEETKILKYLFLILIEWFMLSIRGVNKDIQNPTSIMLSGSCGANNAEISPRQALRVRYRQLRPPERQTWTAEELIRPKLMQYESFAYRLQSAPRNPQRKDKITMVNPLSCDESDA
jgi:hypothetical protein